MTAIAVLPAQNILGQSIKADGLFPIPPESSNDAWTYLKREHFEPFINSAFQFQPAEGRAFNLQLIAVEALTSEINQKRGFNGESYSLLFEGSKKAKIPQGNYQVNHALGYFSLFITAVGLRGNRYEAIINRINI